MLYMKHNFTPGNIAVSLHYYNHFIVVSSLILCQTDTGDVYDKIIDDTDMITMIWMIPRWCEILNDDNKAKPVEWYLMSQHCRCICFGRTYTLTDIAVTVLAPNNHQLPSVWWWCHNYCYTSIVLRRCHVTATLASLFISVTSLSH